jgi:hypothetical protein
MDSEIGGGGGSEVGSGVGRVCETWVERQVVGWAWEGMRRGGLNSLAPHPVPPSSPRSYTPLLLHPSSLLSLALHFSLWIAPFQVFFFSLALSDTLSLFLSACPFRPFYHAPLKSLSSSFTCTPFMFLVIFPFLFFQVPLVLILSLLSLVLSPSYPILPRLLKSYPSAPSDPSPPLDGLPVRPPRPTFLRRPRSL